MIAQAVRALSRDRGSPQPAIGLKRLRSPISKLSRVCKRVRLVCLPFLYDRISLGYYGFRSNPDITSTQMSSILAMPYVLPYIRWALFTSPQQKRSLSSMIRVLSIPQPPERSPSGPVRGRYNNIKAAQETSNFIKTLPFLYELHLQHNHESDFPQDVLSMLEESFTSIRTLHVGPAICVRAPSLVFPNVRNLRLQIRDTYALLLWKTHPRLEHIEINDRHAQTRLDGWTRRAFHGERYLML